MSAEDNREAGTIGDKRGRGYGDIMTRGQGWSGASCVKIRNEDAMTL